MKLDHRLQPWLEIANELESLNRFAHEAGLLKSYDFGAEAAQRMRTISANRWTWYGWKRDGMQSEVRMELRTFHRWNAEGFFYGFENIEAGREVLERIARIEHYFKHLT